ncbi:amidase domain-containing protein [Bacillus dakarensis]|uniref:amidase domain-containing protein n=1 Tax=Robertmurraya dakarensis TaxID=1926278 RepID=UPI000980A351|nr:amidase domain-containing protein [Bacillus dakarensis]
MREQLQELLVNRVNQCVTNTRNNKFTCDKIENKKECLLKRQGEIIKAKATGQIERKESEDDIEKVYYNTHFQYLIKHKQHIYLEEEIEKRVAEFYKNVLVDDRELNPYQHANIGAMDDLNDNLIEEENDERVSFVYNRLDAVKYAERWWNDYNPQFKKFDVDCTNYISQCLHAGNAPMRGYPSRSKGWWMRNNNWSFSWSVANSLRWYLPGAKIGLRGQEVKDAAELELGDVICYDFEGDGRYDHTTIVTGKDSDGMPLVNAHTFNSRKRYWAYEDSTAYTPNIKYKFLHIVDDR